MKKIYWTLVLTMVLNLGMNMYIYGANNGSDQPLNSDIDTDIQKTGDFGIKQETDLDLITKQLNNLEILAGTETGFELDNGLTRAEAAVIVARLSETEGYMFRNYEEKLLHGFKDVPEWANLHIGHLKYIGAIKGITEDEFGPNLPISAQQFVTMILRILGYNDTKGDFVWDQSLDKAVEIGLIDAPYKRKIEQDEVFTRGHMALIVYNTLFQVPNGHNKRFLQLYAKIETAKGLTRIFSIDLTREEEEELRRTDRTHGELFNEDPESFKKFEDKLISSIKPALNFYSIYYNDEEYKIEFNNLNYVSDVRPIDRILCEIETTVYYKEEKFKSATNFNFSLRNNKLVPWGDYEFRIRLGETIITYLTAGKNKIDMEKHYNDMRLTSDCINGNHLNCVVWINYNDKDLEKYAIMFDDNNPKIIIRDYK